MTYYLLFFQMTFSNCLILPATNYAGKCDNKADNIYLTNEESGIIDYNICLCSSKQA